MPDRISFENIVLSASGQPASAGARPSAETPFRILVLGDFSGRESRGMREPLAGRRAVQVDIDNFEQVLARLKPEVAVASEAGPLRVAFASLDDFHPDPLFARLPLFQKLRATRETLRNPATAAAVAAQLAAPTAAAESESESNEETLERLLGRPATEPVPQPAGASGSIKALIRQIVAPHVVPGPDPNVATMTAAVDSAIAAELRAILREPAFKALEAAWRGLDFLVRNLDTDETLQLSLLDVSKPELAADLRGVDDLARSAFFKIAVEDTVRSPGGVPWTIILGDYTFGGGADEVELLARIAKIAAAAGAPFLAAAGAEFVQAALEAGAPNQDERLGWPALRRLREAAWLGLAAPRFLLRLPYGRDTDPVTSFDFEEMPGAPVPDAYLWGNAAFACACLLGQAFRENEWDFSPGDVSELSGLPVHTFSADGEKKMTPCAEHWLTDTHAENLLALGIMPLASIRGRDAVRVVRFQSLADPPRALAGRWS